MKRHYVLVCVSSENKQIFTTGKEFETIEQAQKYLNEQALIQSPDKLRMIDEDCNIFGPSTDLPESVVLKEVEEYSDGNTVCLMRDRDSGEMCVVATNECGYNSTWVNAKQLYKKLKEYFEP